MSKILISILLIIGTNLMSNEIKFEQITYIKSTKNKLWEALTKPELINKYYMCPIKEIGTKRS